MGPENREVFVQPIEHSHIETIKGMIWEFNDPRQRLLFIESLRLYLEAEYLKIVERHPEASEPQVNPDLTHLLSL